MSEVYINRDDAQNLGVGKTEVHLKLLAQHPSMEVMKQTIQERSVVWLTPADTPDMLEFFYILSGNLTLLLDDGDVDLKSGNSFYVDGLTHEIRIKANQPTELLYVTNQPIFDELFSYEADLQNLLLRIDKKDNITYHHSTNVMEYCVRVLKQFSDDAGKMDLMVTAALFHDVGKCFMPDEVLKKPGQLAPSEVRYIMKHPIDTARLLRPCFGDAVASCAQNHHERLDGSGYPFGLMAEDLKLEDRILAAVDAFEAMTAQRNYNTPKTFEEAALELMGLDRQFDIEVSKTLLRLAREGVFDHIAEQTEAKPV